MRKALLAAACFTLFASPIYAQTPVLNPVTPLTGTAGPNGSATPVSPTNPLPISGSFSATLTGFTPNGLYASLTATASTSASTAIPTGSTTVRITNLGAGTVSCTFATGAATGLVNNTQVGPSSSVSRAVGAFDHLACIDQTGSSGSQLVIIEGGAGLGNDTGGGGSGAGGAVTLASSAVAPGAYQAGALAIGAGADCWDATQGCQADAAVAAGAAGTVSAKARLMTSQLNTLHTDLTTLNTTAGNPLASGTNGIGTVDPTTPANWGLGSTGSAVPAKSSYQGANVGGNLTGSIKCGSSIVYDASTNGSTQLVALSGSTSVYVCGYTILAGGTVNVKLITGTGTACVTGTASITPAFQLTAQAGVADGANEYRGLKGAASSELCINTSAGVAVQAIVYYTQF